MFPLKKITLYSNGFTSFERQAQITKPGASSIDLFFRAQDEKEILQSLSCSTIEEGSQVNSVSYQSTKDSEHESAVEIGEMNSMTSLLKSLRGTRVEVVLDLGNQKVTGSLVGVEEFVPPTATTDVRRSYLSIFTDGNSIKTFDLLQISNIRFLDENIQSSVQHALEAYISQKNKDLLKVTIFTQGEKVPYTVKATYSLMAQEWTPSYRLTLQEGSKNATFEALGVIHNTQEEDWKDVQLTLISGSPQVAGGNSSKGNHNTGSMPLTIKRPSNGGSFTIRADPSDLVETIKQKVQSASGDLQASAINLVFAGKRLEEGRTLHDYNIKGDATIHVAITSSRNGYSNESSAPVFRLAEAKNLSFYNIKTPVTVKRNQSALISILKTNIEVNKVLLFDPKIRKGNPLSSLMFMNTTGYTLEEGSIVIKQDNATIGEAQLNQMWPKDETMFPYALELGVEVTIDTNTHFDKPHHVTIKNGEFRIYSFKSQKTTYSFLNKTDRSFDQVYIDHTFIDGWDLVNTPEPVDITDSNYRFEFKVPAGKEKKSFNVTEKSINIETTSLYSMSKEDIQKWIQKSILPKKVEQAFDTLLDLAKQVSSLSKNIYECEQEVRDCKSRQDVLRKNIEVLKDNKQQAKYVNELSTEDDRLTELYSKIKGYTQAKQKINQSHSEECAKVNFDYDVTY